ncbi:MAG: glycosyltransferase family 4 protein [Candidatus Algichlamydia australiensis]|nr:glycosyltransferase family 4 protein [Chlamydiales bacterium]
MRILLVTEKNRPSMQQRDGGSRVVETIKEAFKGSLTILQFAQEDYPYQSSNRFERRIRNARFIGKKVKEIESEFTHIIFLHVSMQFGSIEFPLQEELKIWTFPMFLTPSYEASGEKVPKQYTELEHGVIKKAKNILTPSYLEKEQLISFYGADREAIHVVPRGVYTEYLFPKVRNFCKPLRVCSVGSIKPQKNTLGLVRLFAKICKLYPEAVLQIIGPCQDHSYERKVMEEIKELGLEKHIQLEGYVFPENLSQLLEAAHIHLSCSACETFGRSIFETLALGLPNIAFLKNNAAADFLEGASYIRFVDSEKEALLALEEILDNLSYHSSLAVEVGHLYSDKKLGCMIRAKIEGDDLNQKQEEVEYEKELL